MVVGMDIDNAGVACTPRPACIGCGKPGDLLHAGLTDTLFTAPGVWSLRRCVACGLGWLDPQPRASEIGKFYAGYWTHDAADPIAAAPHGSGGLRRAIKAVLATLLFWRSVTFRGGLMHLQGLAPGRLLDVGCGNGQFLATAAAVGWNATGIDFDEQAVAAARRLPGVRAEVGDLMDQAFPAAAFDAIVLNNVIEHVPDPVATFAECARLLRPGGRLVMITPNLDALGHRAFGPDWRGLEPPRHLHVFRWSRRNKLYQFLALVPSAKQVRVAAGLGVGGGEHFALHLDDSLHRGCSGPCQTFLSPPLARGEDGEERDDAEDGAAAAGDPMKLDVNDLGRDTIFHALDVELFCFV